MRSIRSRPTAIDRRAWHVAWLAAVTLVFVTVVPALAAPTPIRLIDPSVSPRSVQEGKAVTFQVTYKSPPGVVPIAVLVEFDGARYPMSLAPGRQNMHAGTPFVVSVAPPPGSGTVRFLATDDAGVATTIEAGTLVVTAAPSGGSGGSGGGGSGGSGGSGAGSGASGGSASGGSTTPRASGGSAGPSGGGIVAPSSAASDPAAAAAAVAAAAAAAANEAGLPPRPPAFSVPVGSPSSGGPTPPGRFGETEASDLLPDGAPSGAAAPGAGDGREGDGRAGDGKPGTVAGAAPIPGFGASRDPLTAVLPVLVTTFGGVAMLMAFGLFGKRRLDGEPTDSDEALATAAAQGLGAVAPSALVGVAASPFGPGPPLGDAESAMPRWRRPSLLEARKADPTRSVATSDIRLTFDAGLVDMVDGRERRRIRYSIVRLLDRPDEFTASDVGVLDAGDEVQLLERSGVYWFVLCPDGQQGWVHKMVLGETVEEPGLPGPAARATGPRHAGEAAWETPAWALPAATDAAIDVDDDVMAAFLASVEARA